MWPALVARLVPYRTLAVVAVFAVTATGLFVQTVRLDACRESATAKGLVAESAQAIMAAQNAGIEALKAETAALEVAGQKAVADVQRRLAATEKRLAHRLPAPASCEGALDWLIERSKERERQW